MAFCTSCGAQVNGAFCQQCGTPASASAGAAASGQPPTPQPQAMAPPAMSPPPMSPPPAYQAPAAAAPVAAKTSPIVWILVAVAGLFVLGVLSVMALGFFVVHKAKQAGLDPELMSRNPGLAISKLVAATNPDVTVLNTDDRAGTITLRDKKTGQVMTLSFDDVKNGKFKMSATDEHGKTANIEIGGGAGKTPSWVPNYPGAKAEGNFTARGDDGTGKGAGGVVTFTTSDAPSKVMEFYNEKITGAGMKIISTTTAGDTGMIMAASDDEKKSLQVIVGKGSSNETTIGITFGEKN